MSSGNSPQAATDDGRRYMFSSSPRPVNGSSHAVGVSFPNASARQKFRPRPLSGDEELFSAPANMMWDPRVVRGPTRGIPTAVNAARKQQKSEQKRKQRKRHATRRSRVHQTVADLHTRIRTTKTHTEVPLHMYLVEQDDERQRICETDVMTQTDVFLDKEPEAAYQPAKRGLDAGTQVETDLVFQFDRDVVPLLEVLVGKTLEQSLMEVHQEEEMRNVSGHMQRMKDQLGAEADETERLEQEALQRYTTNQRALASARVIASRQQKVTRKMLALSLAKQALRSLETEIGDQLERSGVFFDPVERQTREHFLPHLVNSVAEKLERTSTAQVLVDELLGSALGGLQSQRDAVLAVEDEASARRLKQEQDKRTVIKLYVHSPYVGPEPVGPLSVRGDATIARVRELVLKWIEKNRAGAADAIERITFSHRPAGGAASPNSASALSGDDGLLRSDAQLYELGLENLATLEMHVEERQQQERDASESDPDE